jgi:hypothetical protein
VILGGDFNNNTGARDGERTDRCLDLADGWSGCDRQLRREANHNTPIRQQVMAQPNMPTPRALGRVIFAY